MAKTNVPDSLVVGGVEIRTNAKPDTYDLRDLEYRPMLRLLKPVVDAVLPLDETPAAITRFTAGKRGKIVISLADGR